MNINQKCNRNILVTIDNINDYLTKHGSKSVFGPCPFTQIPETIKQLNIE